MTKTEKRELIKINNKFEKRQFVLVVGDEGAILSYFKGKRLQTRLFANLNVAEEVLQFKNLLHSDEKAPISILIDVMDQSYTSQSLPAVSALSINNLLKKKLEKEYGANNLKGSIFIGRAKTGRSDWNYIFASCPLVPPVSEWLNFVIAQQNPFQSIALLPIEACNLVKQLATVYFPDIVKKNKRGSKENPVVSWQLLILHNKVGGFRQIAIKDGIIIFTRLIAAANEETANFLAGSIEQEILNSLEYLRRLSLKDNDNFDTYIIVSNDIKNSLVRLKIKGKNVLILTPYEAALKLGFQELTAPEDRFSDILISGIIANGKKILPLTTPSLKRLSLLEIINKYALLPSYIIIPITIIYLSIFEYQQLRIKSDITNILDTKTAVELKFADLKKTADSIGDVTKISDIIKLYKLLSGDELSPLNIISEFQLVQENNVLVKSINWQLIEGTVTSSSGNNLNLPNANQTSVLTTYSSVTTLDLEFFNKGEGYQQLFDDFDKFIKKLEANFINYEISYSRLAEKITFNDTNKVIPVQVTITGPKASNRKG